MSHCRKEEEEEEEETKEHFVGLPDFLNPLSDCKPWIYWIIIFFLVFIIFIFMLL